MNLFLVFSFYIGENKGFFFKNFRRIYDEFLSKKLGVDVGGWKKSSSNIGKVGGFRKW